VDKNIQVLKELCDRHVVLVKGKVVFNDNSEQLLSRLDEVESYLGV
jgi:branched-chain amino acid transport system ATP-binding protein